MKTCVIVPDSFKGTMSAVEVCDIISEKVRMRFPNCRTYGIPIADGGEGTVDCFIRAIGGEKRTVKVQGPYGENMNSFYGVVRGNTAVVEMAAAAGLPLAEGKKMPGKASTYGVGQLIAHGVKSGCRQVILGLGGSCTNDGGAGMAAALGTRFFRKDGSCFIPCGDSLEEVAAIDNSRTERFLSGVAIQGMCDIENPMFGEKGAAFIFGPQKGADAEEIQVLDRNLRQFSETIKRELRKDVSGIPGSGAAGAMGAGVCAFLDGKLVSGIELLLETVGFDHLMRDCDVVITGEGKLDRQSFGGKVLAGVVRHAEKFHVPVIAIAGYVEPEVRNVLEDFGVQSALSVYDQKLPLEQILPTCKADLGRKAEELGSYISNCALSLDKRGLYLVP